MSVSFRLFEREIPLANLHCDASLLRQETSSCWLTFNFAQSFVRAEASASKQEDDIRWLIFDQNLNFLLLWRVRESRF